jgi:hypothetical protein
MINQADRLTIAEKVYLLQCNAGKRKLNDRGLVAPRLIRAGVLADLAMSNAIEDRNGCVSVIENRNPPDAVSAFALARIYASKPRKWKDWIQRDQRQTVDKLEDLLEDRGLITVNHNRILWVFPTREVIVHDTSIIDTLRQDVRTVTFGVEPVGQIEPERAVLAAIVASAEMRPVISRQVAKFAKGRIEEILRESGPIGPALRKAIRETQTSIAVAASSAAVISSTTSS